MVASTKHKRKEERQAVLREYLAERGKLSYIFDSIEKLELADSGLNALQVQSLKAATDQRIKLLDKYLPSMKQVEMDNHITMQDNDWTVKLVNAEPDASIKPK